MIIKDMEMKMYNISQNILDEGIPQTVKKFGKKYRDDIAKARQEAAYQKQAREAGITQYAKITKNDFKIVEESIRNLNIKKYLGVDKEGKDVFEKIKNASDFKKSLKKGQVKPGELGRLQKNLLRRGGKDGVSDLSPQFQDKLIDNFTNVKKIQNDYKNLSNDQIGLRLSEAGYGPETRKKMLESFKKKGIGKFPSYGSEASGAKTAAAAEKDGVTSGAKTKPTDQIPQRPKRGFIRRAGGKLSYILIGMLGPKTLKFLFEGGILIFGGAKAKKAFEDKIAKNKRELEEPIVLPPCIYQLLSTPKCELLPEKGPSDNTGPTMVIGMKKTGNPDYDKSSGLKFYMDGTLSTGDGKHRGRWSCKESQATIEENVGLQDIFENILFEEEFDSLNEDVKTEKIDRAVDVTVARLEGAIKANDFRKIHTKLWFLKSRKFQGENALTVVMDRYEEKTGTSLINDIQSEFKDLNPRTQRLRSSLLNMLQKKSRERLQNPISGIDIVWDDGWEPSSGKSVDIGSDISYDDEDTSIKTPPPTSLSSKTSINKSAYTKKTDYPFVFGDKNDRIREIQACLGLEKKYQTGNFGPITRDALNKNNYGEVITPEVYKKILLSCKPIVNSKENPQIPVQQTTSKVKSVTPVKQTSDPSPKLPPKPVVKTPQPERITPVEKAPTSQITPDLSKSKSLRMTPIAQQQMLTKNQPKEKNKGV